MGRSKIDPENRRELLRVYREKGGVAARAIAPSLGFKPSYVGCLAKRNGVSSGRGISPENRDKILKVYRTKGVKAAQDLGARLGIKPQAVSKLAWKYKVKAAMPDGDGFRPTYSRDEDPRWARAIAIGPVLA